MIVVYEGAPQTELFGSYAADCFDAFIGNKHSESIAKAIQVSYLSQQIWKRQNYYKSR